MKKLFLLSLPVALLASACTVNQGDFTVLSNKIVDTKDFDLNGVRNIKNVSGKEEFSSIFILLNFGLLNPDYNSAMNDCFKKADADLLVNVHCYSTCFWIPFIYGNNAFYVEGDALRTRLP